MYIGSKTTKILINQTQDSQILSLLFILNAKKKHVSARPGKIRGKIVFKRI